MKARMIRIACLGALALAAGCVSTERETVLAKGGLAPDPEPRTRAYYRVKIKDRYQHAVIDEKESQPVPLYPITHLGRNVAVRQADPFAHLRKNSPASSQSSQSAAPIRGRSIDAGGTPRFAAPVPISGKLATPAPASPFAVLVTNETVRIIKYRGPDAKVAIPERIDGLPVVAILASAFDGCHGVTEVTIPATVTSIADSAFRNCPALESILVDVMNPVYSSSSDGVLFNMEKTRLLRYPPGRAGTYTVPQRTTEIGSDAFANCGKLTGLILHDGVTRFGWAAASRCTNLAEVVLGEGIVHIGNSAFANCSSLRRVRMPASLRDVVWNLFSGCDRLEAIEIAEGNPHFRSDADGVVFSKDGTRLLRYPSGRKGDYVVPASVTQIGGCAFEGSSGLTGITLSEGLEGIEDYTFKLCRNLTRIAIPNSVTRIGGQAFALCSSLSEIALPSSIANIEGYAFGGCTNLTVVAFSGDAPTVAGNALHNTHPDLTVQRLPDAKGWGETFGGRPVKMWQPERQQQSGSDVSE